MTDQKNTILAIVLSAVVLIAWQYFFAHAAAGEAASRSQQQQAQQQAQTPQQPGAPGQPGQRRPTPAIPAHARRARRSPGQAAGAPAPRESAAPAALAASPRVPIADRRASQGSISLKGGRIDDLALVKYRETVDPKSPPIVLLSPSGSAEPFYAEFGWVGDGPTSRCPTPTRCGRSRAPARSTSASR